MAFLGKEVRVFLRGQALKSYLELKKRTDKEAKILVNSIERVISILKENPQFGAPIKKELIPKNLRALEIKNLYCADLSNYWRMLYTIEGTKIEVLLFILNIVDHKEYNRLFSYR